MTNSWFVIHVHMHFSIYNWSFFSTYVVLASSFIVSNYDDRNRNAILLFSNCLFIFHCFKIRNGNAIHVL